MDAAGNSYVADTFNSRIQKFDSSGAYLTQFGSFGSGNGQLFDPYSVAIDAAGDIYVADPSNNRIQVFTPDQHSTTLDDGQSESFELAPGNYMVSELVPDGWTLDDISCDGGSPSYGDTTVTVTLDPTDDVVCTFMNSAVVVPPPVYRLYLPMVRR